MMETVMQGVDHNQPSNWLAISDGCWSCSVGAAGTSCLRCAWPWRMTRSRNTMSVSVTDAFILPWLLLAHWGAETPCLWVLLMPFFCPGCQLAHWGAETPCLWKSLMPLFSHGCQLAHLGAGSGSWAVAEFPRHDNFLLGQSKHDVNYNRQKEYCLKWLLEPSAIITWLLCLIAFPIICYQCLKWTVSNFFKHRSQVCLERIYMYMGFTSGQAC